MKQILLLFFLLVSVFSCKDSDPVKPTPEPSLVIEDGVRYHTVQSSGGSIVVKFTSSGVWNAWFVTSDSWISVDRSSGNSGTNSIVVSLMSNEGFEDRNSTLQISTGNVSQKIEFIQKQKDVINLSSNKFEISCSGETIEIEAKSNIDYTFSIPEKFSGWIECVETKSYDSKTFLFNVKANENIAKREGKILFSPLDTALAVNSQSVQILQEGEIPYIKLYPDSSVLEYEGGIISTEIQSNCDVQFRISDSCQWIAPLDTLETKTLYTDKYSFVVSENNSDLERSAEIIFYSNECNITETMLVSQKPTVHVSSVTLDKSYVEILEGESFLLSAMVLPDNAANKEIQWESSDNEVAVVENGTVKTLKSGEAYIYAICVDGGIKDSCKVMVNAKIYPVSTITLDSKSLTLIEGESAVLSVTILPENATNKNVVWKSSNNVVAIVESGSVRAQVTGSAIITVISEDGGKTDSCTVFVKKKSSGDNEGFQEEDMEQ